MNCETTNKKNIALKTFDVNNMKKIIQDLEFNRGKEDWSVSVNRVSNGVANGDGMELSKDRTEVYENGAIIEVMDMSIDTQIECMELSKSCARAQRTGLERGQQLRKYRCIARRYRRFIGLLNDESLRKTYTYLDEPWRAANGARFFNPPPVAEYDAWMEALREEGLEFEKQAHMMEVEGGILYEDVSPCRDGSYKGEKSKDGPPAEKDTPASDDGVIVKTGDLDEPDFVNKVTVIGDSATVKMENSVIETGAIDHSTIGKMEPVDEDAIAAQGRTDGSHAVSPMNTSGQ